MFAAGYKTLSAVASASPDELVKAVQFMPRKVSRQVVASAKVIDRYALFYHASCIKHGLHYLMEIYCENIGLLYVVFVGN